MHPVIEKIQADLKRRADRNGDGKINKADVDAAVTQLRAEADQLVSKRGALAACASTFAVGLAVGGALMLMVA